MANTPKKTPLVDLGKLLRRIAPPPVPGAQDVRPFVASATALFDGGRRDKTSQWVILHSITDATAQLFHSRPLRSRQLSLRIDCLTGEIMQVEAAVASTFARGELYETTANFYRL